MSSTAICQLCQKEPHKYCCPRCNILYCSVDCYRSQTHQQCSESFYKECVVEEIAMQNQRTNTAGLNKDTKKMYEILNKLDGAALNEHIYDEDSMGSEIDSDDDLPDSELAARLEGINLEDPNAIWDKLTSNERQEFERIIQSKDITTLLPVFRPWWLDKNKENLIEEISSDPKPSTPPQIPNILPNINDFSNISTKTPANCIKHNLINVLATYALVVRIFNGDHLNNTHEVTNYLIGISGNLNRNQNFDDGSLAIESVAFDCQNKGLPFNAEQMIIIKEDIRSIVEGPDVGKSSNLYILGALSDIHAVLALAKVKKIEKLNFEQTGEFSKRFLDYEIINLENVSKTMLNACLKKIEYYLSFAKTHFC